MTITPEQLDILRLEFEVCDDEPMLAKITLRFDEKTRTVTIEWWDFDYETLHQLIDAAAQQEGIK